MMRRSRWVLLIIIVCVVAALLPHDTDDRSRNTYVYGTCDVVRTFEQENFGSSSRSLPQKRDPVLVFGMATSDYVLKDNPIPAGCVLSPPSTEREMQSLTEGVASLDAAFDLYAAECNKMVFGEGIKKKFLVFKPNRYGIF